MKVETKVETAHLTPDGVCNGGLLKIHGSTALGVNVAPERGVAMEVNGYSAGRFDEKGRFHQYLTPRDYLGVNIKDLKSKVPQADG